MKLKDLLEGVSVEKTSVDMTCEIIGVTADSRAVKPGMLFIAIRGTKSDGHAYIPQAEKAGAACIIAEEDYEGESVVVPDTRAAYSLIAANWFGRPADKLVMMGVTGTNGKTSSAFLFKHIIDTTGGKCGLVGTIEIDTGVRTVEADVTTPDAMLLQGYFAEMVACGCTHCAMEVSSHALDQHRVEGIRYACGLFTNLTQDHLDYHGDMATYLAAKAKLFDVCDAGVFNYDDPSTAKLLLRSKAPINMTYSITADEADMTAKNVVLKPDGVEYQAVIKGQIARVNAALPGEFNVYNTLGVLTACVAMGMPLIKAADALRSAKGIKGRIEVVPTNTPYTVYIDYSHTPDSLVNIGRALRGIAKGRIITVFGCGGDRDRGKRPLMAKAAEAFSDYFILTSDNPRTEDPQRIIDDAYAGVKGTTVPHEVMIDRRQAIAHALAQAGSGDTVLIAGKGHETYQILATGKIHFDEREVVHELLGEIEK